MKLTRILSYLMSNYWARFLTTIVLFVTVFLGSVWLALPDVLTVSEGETSAKTAPASPTAVDKQQDEIIAALLKQVSILQKEKEGLKERVGILAEEKAQAEATVMDLKFKKIELESQLKVSDFMNRVLSEKNKEMGELYDEVFK